MDYKFYELVTILIFFTTLIVAQEKSFQEQQDSTSNTNSISSIDGTAAINDEINFKNATGNSIITITDEGSNKGSITLPELSSPPTSTTDEKLYNVNGVLNFDGSALGSGGASSIDNLVDAQHSESSLYMGFGTGGTSDDGNNNNTGIGFQSLYNNTSGNNNVGNGYQSLYTNTIGKMNTAIGSQSLYSNQDGSNNVANGHQALFANTDGRNNTANGSLALLNNISGDNNTATGYRSLLTNSGGSKNSSYGYQTQYSNTTGSSNTVVGYQSLYSNSVGVGNVMLGYQAGYNELTSNKLYIENSNSSSPLIWGDFASDSVKINGNFHVNGNITYDGTLPYGSLSDLTDVVNDADFVSIYLGTGISEPITPGSYQNTAFGHEALINIDEGDNNTALGYRALKNISTGEHNVAVGSSALPSTTSGGNNIAVGFRTLLSNETGSSNIAIGHTCLQTGTGNNNTGIGEESLYRNFAGSNNVAVGPETLRFCENGNYNTAIGVSAGRNLPNNTIYSVAVGANAAPTGSFQARIGSSSTISIGGQVGWTTLSDGRYKRNIEENVSGIEFVMGLRPVTYNFDIEGISEFLQEDYALDENGNSIKEQPSQAISNVRESQSIKRNTGFIAQEVEELANELGFDFSGVEVPENEQSVYRLRYAEFVVPIVKAMQEQQVLINELRKEIEQIKSK